MKFQTIAKLRSFLRQNGQEFKGVYETYSFEGRTVRFVAVYSANIWGRQSEVTEMVIVN